MDIHKNACHPRQRLKTPGTKCQWHYPSGWSQKNGQTRWQSVEGQAGDKAELTPADDPIYMYDR